MAAVAPRLVFPPYIAQQPPPGQNLPQAGAQQGGQQNEVPVQQQAAPPVAQNIAEPEQHPNPQIPEVLFIPLNSKRY